MTMYKNGDNKKPKRLGKKSAIFLFGILAAYFFFIGGYVLGLKGIKITTAGVGRIVGTETNKPSDVDFSLYWEAWNKLKEKTVLGPDSKKMLQGSISGMLASLGDPYTIYFEPDENKRFREDIAGEFGGIGIEIIPKNGYPTVVAPLSGSPAEKAGIKANDIIMEVDGSKTAEIGFDTTINKIRGDKGTKVNLKMAREGTEAPTSIDVTRDTIIVKSVEWNYQDQDGKKYLIVKIRQFGSDTAALFGGVVDEALRARPDGIIVDLRNNPGGYLETSVDLASNFIDGGVVVSEKGKDGKSKDYKTTGRPRLKGFKVAVLVNKGSASASEIFSGALQDRGGGKIIGDKTFGKGSVQELADLSDGSAIKVTVAKWYTPSGRSIDEQGIEPDVQVGNSDETSADEQLDRAFEYLKTGK